MKKLCLLALALIFVLAVPAHADTISVTSTYTWYDFSTDGIPGVSTSSDFDIVANNNYSSITVLDGYFAGDDYLVYDNGVLLGTTSVVDVQYSTYCDNAADCLAEGPGVYSTGTFLLPQGDNDVTIVAGDAPLGANGGWIEVVTPEPGTFMLLGTGLAGLLSLMMTRKLSAA
jgi:hypothetical protein